MEPRYNNDLGTMKITLLYQVSRYIRVKNKELGPAKLPCYIRPLYNEVPLYVISQNLASVGCTLRLC